MKNIGKVIWFLIIFGIIGILAIIFSPYIPNARWSEVVNNIGLGFLVACIVGILVELYVREQMKIQMQQMLKDIGSNVFKASLGQEFPESIWEQVTTHLLLNQFLRKDLNIDCIIEKLQGREEFVKVQMSISYTLKNLNSIQKANYPFACSIDRCTHADFRDSTKFNSIKVGGQDISLDECRIDTADDAEITCRKWLVLNKGEETTISINSESVYRNHETTPFSLTDPTENFMINISKPSDITLAVDTLHPREERLIETPTASPTSHRCWRISGGLLPGNGVSVRWFPS